MEKSKGRIIRFIFLLFITFSSFILASSATLYDTSYIPTALIEFIAFVLITIALYGGYYLFAKYKFKAEYKDRFFNFLTNGFRIQLIVGLFWAVMFFVNRYNSASYEEVKHLKTFVLDPVAWIILIAPFIIKIIFIKSPTKKAS